MKSFLLLLVVVAAVAAYEQPLIHYHSAAGIAQAERIKQFESALDFDGSSRIAGGQSGGLIISLTNGRQSACGSSMLTNTRAVTAAHCWWDGQNQGRQLTVVYGSNRLFSGGVRVNTNNVQMHQQYNTRTLHNDIAIIVHGHVGFSNTINRVNIASGNNNFAGQTATAAGYGRIGDNVDISPNQDKRQVNMPVITNAACISTFGPISIISSTLCTSGAGGRSICPGDSGGPLTVGSGNNRVLIGVSSFVHISGCTRGHPAGFARVTSFNNWIRQRL
ncbi:hypothetical protein ABMA27_003587 [Loxostege sticticalis]|uniref:Peptidase S1 domain-containing protein n=1 Tax=Loxostege sticticalis TaxID=481309 RepID=A0ABR3HPT6_LOXSC